MPYICQICGTMYQFGICPKCAPPRMKSEEPMYKTKPICSKCGISMEVHMIGLTLVEMAFDPPVPYAMISVDEYKCPSCGCKVISKFADKPFSRHHDEDFKPKLLVQANTNPMKIRVEWEHIPSAHQSENPVAYLIEWLGKAWENRWGGGQLSEEKGEKR